MDAYTYVLSTNGLLFFLSLVFKVFPPKKINNLYGYRTHKTMQNQDIWEFANKTFNDSFWKYSGISFLAAMALATFSSGQLTWQPMLLIMLSILVSIIKTEREISDNFTEEGKRKKKSSKN